MRPYVLIQELGGPIEAYDTVDALARRICDLRQPPRSALILVDGMIAGVETDRDDRGRRAVVVRHYDQDRQLAGERIGLALVVSRAGLGSYGERRTLSEALRRIDPDLELGPEILAYTKD